MSTAYQPLYEINHRAIQVLCREMGIVNTLRFIRQFTSGYGNYTMERDMLQEGKAVADIVSEIKEMRGKADSDK